MSDPAALAARLGPAGEPEPTPPAVSRAPWRAPPDPRAVLRAAGVAAPEAVAAATLQDLSRSHTLTVADLPDGAAYVVKRVSREAHDAGRSLAAELYAYRLASWHEELAEVLPPAVHLDERRQVVVLVAAPSAHLFPAQCMTDGFPSPALNAALGHALAVLHAATTHVALLTVAACGVLLLPDTPEEERHLGDDSEAARALASEIVADACLAAALRETAAALRPTCLIHADVKWDNAVLDPGPPARVRLFDLELSGRGDPAWDVGSALADTMSLPIRLRGIGVLPAEPGRWVTPALRALLAAYAARAPAVAGAPDVAERIAGCWIARTVHLALECAAALDDAAHPAVQDLLAAGRLLARGRGDIVRGVGDALSAAR